MLRTKIENLADMIMENEKNTVKDKEIIVYGLQSATTQGLGMISVAVLGCIFGLLWESIVFLVSFSAIRMYAGGYHCQKAIHCYIISSFVVVATLIVVEFTLIFYMVKINLAMLLISIPIILKFAPVGTPTKMLEAEETEYFCKKVRRNLLLECVAIAVLLYFEMYDYAYVVGLGVFVSAMLVLLGWYRKI